MIELDSDVVIWGIQETNRIRIGRSIAAHSPIPFGARVIARVPECDADMMRRWCKRRAKRGWSVDRMIEACEAS